MLVAAAGAWFSFRDPDKSAAPSVGDPLADSAAAPVLSASDVAPALLLSDAPATTGRIEVATPPAEGTGTNGVASAQTEEAGEAADSPATSPPPRVVMSRIFIPYAAPAAMISLAPAGDTAPDAAPVMQDAGLATNTPDTASGSAYVDLAAMLGAAPTGEVARRTWTGFDSQGSGAGTNVSAVLAMIMGRPDEEKMAPDEASTSDPQSISRVMYFVREGDSRMSEGLIEEAAKAYNEALAIYPQLTYANQQVGRLNLVLGKYDEAIKNLQAALEASDDIGEALNDLGVAFMYAGRIEEALESFDAALQAEPEQMDPVFNTGLAMRMSGRLADAREQFNTYLNIIPRDARAMRELAVIDMLENQRETALRRLIIAIEYDDTWATPMLDAALLFAEMGINDRALALMERALDRASVREVYQVYMQDPFRNIRLSPEGKPFEAKLAAKARTGK